MNRLNWLRAYPTMIRSYSAMMMAYRGEMFIWVLTGLLPLFMMAVWLVIAKERPVAGYDQTAFISYYLMVILIRRMTGVWIIWDMDNDIRQGTLSFKLLKPIHPAHDYFVQQGLATKPVWLLLVVPPIVVAAILMGARYDLSLGSLLLTVLASFIGLLLEFFAQGIVGTLAFWVTQVIALAEFWYVIRLICSGWLVPLEMFPPAVTQVLIFLPFRYIIAFPIDIIMGRLNPEQITFGFVISIIWIVILSVGFQYMWKRGLKRYGAVGA
jgi:ABC-2 type transport system permease protein